MFNKLHSYFFSIAAKVLVIFITIYLTFLIIPLSSKDSVFNIDSPATSVNSPAISINSTSSSLVSPGISINSTASSVESTASPLDSTTLRVDPIASSVEPPISNIDSNTPIQDSYNITSVFTVKLCDHLSLFTPLMASAYDGFRELGINVEVVGESENGQRYDLNDQESIFITALTHEGGRFPKNYIAYNWEQLTAHEILNPNGFREMMPYYRNALEVWDYSEANVEMFKRHGINARVVLPGYHDLWVDDSFSWKNGFKNKKYISSFFGQYRDERIPWLERLKKELPSEFSILGTPEVFSAKAVINIHIFSNGTILEIHRIMQVVSQKTLVLSQRSEDKSLDNLYGPMVTFFSTFEDLREKIFQINAMTEVEYEKEVIRRFKYFQNLPRFAQNFNFSASVLSKSKEELFSK